MLSENGFSDVGPKIRFFCYQKRPFLIRHFLIKFYKAGSYGNEKLIRKWTRSVFFVFFDLMGTRMVQIRIAKSV